MNSTEFFDVFDNLSGTARLIFMMKMKEQNYEYWLESHPEAVMQRFLYENIDIDDVAKVIIECFGTVIICRESSYCQGSYQTILDALDYELDASDDNSFSIHIQSLKNALIKNGVMQTRDIDLDTLKKEYIADPSYASITSI